MTQLITLDQWDAGKSWSSKFAGGCVSIGNFDGVHCGHRELLGYTRRQADAVDGPAVVVVLDPHPAAVLRPSNAPPKLTTVARRAALMSPLGIDALLVCPATIDFLNWTAEEFFDDLVRQRLQARAMVEGPNFFFGRDRAGDVRRLGDFCDAVGMTLQIVEPAIDGGRLISSSRIREAIAAGDLRTAQAMLGSAYQITGLVAEGERRGRTLGFPTANLTGVEVMTPGHGVYAAEVSWGDSAMGESRHLAAVHIGPNPTFDDRTATKVEVHVLDYDGNLYGSSMTVQFVDKIRDVRRFESPDALVEQLAEDVRQVRRLANANRL